MERSRGLVNETRVVRVIVVQSRYRLALYIPQSVKVRCDELPLKHSLSLHYRLDQRKHHK